MIEVEHTIENTQSGLESKQHTLLVEAPEVGENFSGQRILVIGGSDAHGLSMMVASAKHLENLGARVDMYIGSPIIREGKGATHSASFFDKTLPSLNTAGVDRVVIADIPLNSHNLTGSEEKLIELSTRLAADRKERGLPAIDGRVLFLDHHSTSKFEPAWQPGHGRGVAPRFVELNGIQITIAPTAEKTRLGNDISTIARIGAIADRDESMLPVTDDDMLLARGLDCAIRPIATDPKPVATAEASEEEALIYRTQLKAWEDRIQARMELAVHKLYAEDWEYFRQEALTAPKMEVPTASGFGNVAIVDTQKLGESYLVLKHIEQAIENAGVDTTPYALAMQRNLKPQGRAYKEPADTITLVKHWTRTDLPTVRALLEKALPPDVLAKLKMYGHPNATSMRLPVDDRNTATIMARLVEALAGRELPDFSKIKSVVMCGDPNSGKSVYSSIFREALKILGVKVSHLDLDKAAPTPQWYLDAEIGYKEVELLHTAGKASNEQLAIAHQTLEAAAQKRRDMKRPWSIDLAEEAKQELLAEAAKDDVDFVIGDIGGGRITKDENGKTIKIQRLTKENARILEGADAVIIVSNNQAGLEEWRKLIETGVDEETGIRIQRETPIEVIGMYQSVLEGAVQRVPGTRREAGVITNLDRTKSDRIYNPAVLITAMFISEAVEKRKKQKGANYDTGK